MTLPARLLILATSSPEKEDFYRRLLEPLGIVVLSADVFAKQASAAPEETGTSREKNIQGKATKLQHDIEKLIEKPANFWGTLFFHRGWITKPEKPFEEQTVENILNSVDPEYQSYAQNLIDNPQSISFLVDDSKINLDNIRFQDLVALEKIANISERQLNSLLDAVYALQEGDFDPEDFLDINLALKSAEMPDTQKQAIIDLMRIIHHACADVAEEAWDKANEEQKLSLDEQEAWVEAKANALYAELIDENKGFPGAMAANFYSAAGSAHDFIRMVFAAFGKGPDDHFDLTSASTIQALHLDYDGAETLICRCVTSDTGETVFDDENAQHHQLRHPDYCRHQGPLTLDHLIALDGFPLSDPDTDLTRYGGRYPALTNAGLIPESPHTECLPINQKNIPIVVMVGSEENKNDPNVLALIKNLTDKGHTVTIHTFQEVLPASGDHDDFDLHSQCANSDLLEDVIDNHGVCIIVNDGSLASLLLQARVKDMFMIGPLSVRQKQLVVVETLNEPNQIQKTVHVMQHLGLTPIPLSFWHTAFFETFPKVFENMVRHAPVRLQQSLHPAQPNVSPLKPLTQEENQTIDSGAVDNDDDPIVVGLIGSATLKDRKTLAKVEKDLREQLDILIIEAKESEKKIILTHGAGHGGCMEIFNRVCAEYAKNNNDLISVIGVTTPELLYGEGKGKPPMGEGNSLFVRRLFPRARAVTPGRIYCAPGGVGTLHELLLAVHAITHPLIRLIGFDGRHQALEGNFNECMGEKYNIPEQQDYVAVGALESNKAHG